MRSDLREIARCMMPASLGNVLNVTLAPTAKFTPVGRSPLWHDFDELRTVRKDEYRIYPSAIFAD